MSDKRILCPNCGAYGLTVDDHNTGKSSPDKWQCDTISGMDQQPNFLLTYQAAKAVQEALKLCGTSHYSPHLKLADLFDD